MVNIINNANITCSVAETLCIKAVECNVFIMFTRPVCVQTVLK